MLKTREVPHIAKVHRPYVDQYTPFPFHCLLGLTILILTNNASRLVDIAKKLGKQFPGSGRAPVSHHTHRLNDMLSIISYILVWYGTLQEKRLQVSGIYTWGMGTRWGMINTCTRGVPYRQGRVL